MYGELTFIMEVLVEMWDVHERKIIYIGKDKLYFSSFFSGYFFGLNIVWLDLQFPLK